MLLSSLALVSVGGLLSPPTAVVSPPPQDTAPRLVVLLMVDQLRPDHLLRYRAEWTGGFKRLLDGGIFFPDGRQDHAITQTGPGHSTVLSGRFPAHTGIVTNDLGGGKPYQLRGASNQGKALPDGTTVDRRGVVEARYDDSGRAAL